MDFNTVFIPEENMVEHITNTYQTTIRHRSCCCNTEIGDYEKSCYIEGCTAHIMRGSKNAKPESEHGPG